MKSEKGQSLIEIIFSVGVVSLVLVGVVSLMVNVIGTKNSSLQRKKANEMGNVIVEKLLEDKKRDPENFWKLNSITTPQILEGFDAYQYTVVFTKVITPGGCRDEDANGNKINDCANAVINITWNSNEDTYSINRFFSRRI